MVRPHAHYPIKKPTKPNHTCFSPRSIQSQTYKTHSSFSPPRSSSHTPSDQNPTKLKNLKPTNTFFFPTHNIHSKTQSNPMSHCSFPRAHHPIQSNPIDKPQTKKPRETNRLRTFAELVALALDPRDNLALRHGGAQRRHENLSNLRAHHEPRAMPPAAARLWGGNERGDVPEEGRRRRGGVKTTHGGGGGRGGHRQLQRGRHGCNAIQCNAKLSQAKHRHVSLSLSRFLLPWNRVSSLSDTEGLEMRAA